MASISPDQAAMMKEILEALKTLQMNQAQLASNVDAISGRVNVLAGMKEVGGIVATQVSHTRTPSTGTSRIILTTYPGQSGINPLPMDWGNKDCQKRGPVVVSRGQTNIQRRNAIGAHGGSYSIYYPLAAASHEIKIDYRPDFTNTEPAANIGPFPQWADKKEIVSIDPLGHLAPWLFKDTIEKDNDSCIPVNTSGIQLNHCS